VAFANNQVIGYDLPSILRLGVLQLRQPKGSSASKKGGFGGVGFVMQQAIVILVLSNVVFGICVGLHEVSYGEKSTNRPP
jgi:hypothetical protein